LSMKFNVKKYFQVLGTALGVIFLAFMVVMGFDFSGGGASDGDEGVVAVEDGGTINVLMMCTDNDGLRTDAIMLASYNTETNAVNMLSVPRDLRMYIGNRYQKINAAHAFSKDGVIGGPAATCEAVTRLTGVPINYYVDFSFAAIAKIMDELGPITFTIPDLYGDGVGMVYDDPAQDLHINLPPGTYELNGEQVVHLLRYRKGNPDPVTNIRKTYPGGDADRIKVQQDFVRALVDQKLNLALIKKIPSIFSDVKSEIKTNFTVKDILKYSKYLKNFSSAGINSITLPCDATHDSANGDVFIPNMNKLQTIVRDMFGGTGDNMWYAEPGVEPQLYSSGYMTVGGYVRSTDKGVLSTIKATEATNDELCLIRGIDQSDDIEEGVAANTFEE
jgi:LCP family protein required for cell wall assembly